MTFTDILQLGAVGGFVLWLLSYSGEKILDRAVLPHVESGIGAMVTRARDWWARRNRKRAMKRADRIALQFYVDRRDTMDARFTALKAQSASQDRTIVILGVIVFSAMGSAPESAATSLKIAHAILVAVYVLGISYTIIREFNSMQRAKRMLLAPEAVRAEMRQRAKRLLVAARLPDADMDKVLKIFDVFPDTSVVISSTQLPPSRGGEHVDEQSPGAQRTP